MDISEIIKINACDTLINCLVSKALFDSTIARSYLKEATPTKIELKATIFPSSPKLLGVKSLDNTGEKTIAISWANNAPNDNIRVFRTIPEPKILDFNFCIKS